MTYDLQNLKAPRLAGTNLHLFTLALAYERTRDLATPMLAHAAWNFGEAVMLLTVFR